VRRGRAPKDELHVDILIDERFVKELTPE